MLTHMQSYLGLLLFGLRLLGQYSLTAKIEVDKVSHIPLYIIFVSKGVSETSIMRIIKKNFQFVLFFLRSGVGGGRGG